MNYRWTNRLVVWFWVLSVLDWQPDKKC